MKFRTRKKAKMRAKPAAVAAVVIAIAIVAIIMAAVLFTNCAGKASKAALPAAEPEIAFTLPEELAGHWMSYSGAAIGGPGEMELLRDGTGTACGEAVAWKVINSRLVLLPRDEGADEGDMPSHAYRVDGIRLMFVNEDGDSGLYVKKGYADAILNGKAYMNNEDYDNAVAEFTEATRLDSGLAAGYYFRGLAYHDKKDYDSAVADFFEVIRLEPGSEGGYIGRSNAYYEKGDYAAAVADFNSALEICPDNADAIEGLEKAKGLLQKGKP
jgi:tetratricopeptide (TPR) repeat protein